VVQAGRVPFVQPRPKRRRVLKIWMTISRSRGSFLNVARWL
jgi:hypothetical protein